MARLMLLRCGRKSTKDKISLLKTHFLNRKNNETYRGVNVIYTVQKVEKVQIIF
jgi:hypothetical protein